MKTNHRHLRIYLIIVILLQLIVIVYTGYQKEGFHVDEIFSFVFANSYENPKFDQGMYHTWFQPQFFSDMVRVSADHQFSYRTTYQNQTRDVHPPLFYFLLHTICSFFPENFSLWFGLIINIAFFVFCNYFIYLIGKDLFENQLFALLPSIIWGFSAGALSTVIFIRMYMLLTALVVITFYLHLLLIKNDAPKSALILFFLLTFMGILTHYYFIIVVILMAINFGAILIIGKHWSQLFKYWATQTLAMFAGIIFYPSMLDHLFMSYRGREAFNAIGMFPNYLKSIYSFYNLISEQQFSGNLTYFILLLLLLCFVIILRRFVMNKNNGLSIEGAMLDDRKGEELSIFIFLKDNYKIVTLLVTTILVFFILAIISPYLSTRYLFMIYPFVSILTIYFFTKSLELFTDNKSHILFLVLLIFMILNFLSLSNGNIDYLYSGYNDVISIADTYSDFPCVFITNRLWTLRSNVFELAKFKETIFMPAENMKPLPEIKFFDKSSRGLILYIDNMLDRESILAYVTSSFGFNDYELLYTLDLNSAYLLFE